MGQSQIIDITGKRFGRLVAIERLPWVKYASSWKCRCDCGKEVVVGLNHLRTGHTTSCGCRKREIEQSAHLITQTHGMSKTGIYKIWSGMVNRCENPNEPAYALYGARGITVSPEFRVFETFYSIVGDRPKGMTLERKDNNKGYSPDNVIWADRTAQARNRRTTRWVTIDGQAKSFAEWCQIYGVSQGRVKYRIACGMPCKEAFTEPRDKRGGWHHTS